MNLVQALIHVCGWTPGMLALPLGGFLGSFHRAYRSPTQETWSDYRVFGVRLPSPKTLSDMILGALCSVGLPKFGDLLLPDFINLRIGEQTAGIQFLIAYGIAFVISWEATVRGWVLRERGREPDVKNAAPALQPAKTIEEMQASEPSKP